MNRQDQHLDRRRGVTLREILTPVITAIIVGIGSSFLTVSFAVNSLQLKVQYLEKNVDTLLQLVKDMNYNSLQITKIEVWKEEQIKTTDKIVQRIEILEKR